MNTHTFNNSSGLGHVRIKPFILGDYLFLHTPWTITWADCRGSVGKYVTLLNEHKEVRDQISNILQQQLNSGDKLNTNILFPQLQSFCAIFPPGRINIGIYPNEFPAGTIHPFEQWGIVIPNLTDKANEQSELDKYLTLYKKQVATSGWSPGDDIDYMTAGFYDGGREKCIIFTQTRESLDNTIIARYEKEIKNGKRPYCMIYSSSTNDNSYLLDGHHKAIAYQNLKIRPAIIEIHQFTEELPLPTRDEWTNDLFDRLYHCQLQHIFDNGLAYQPQLDELIKSPHSPFSIFIRNGYIESYWPDGTLRSKGNYKDNRPQGIIEDYYENGDKKSTILFSDKEQRVIRSWFPTGELGSEWISKQDNDGEQVSYHDTGEISGRTIYKDGRIADGKSSFTYTKKGKITYKAEYKNAYIIAQTWYDEQGKIIQQYRAPNPK